MRAKDFSKLAQLSLWDLLGLRDRKGRPVVAPSRRPSHAKGARSATRERYDAMTRSVLTEHGIRVRKWRSSMSGVAWEVHYQDGRVARLIEAPRPRGPMSAAIFLHEVGHHAIGLGAHRPRCLEELRAWEWAIAEMERRHVAVTDRVRARMRESMQYAVYKARKRGLKRLPADLAPFAISPWD